MEEFSVTRQKVDVENPAPKLFPMLWISTGEIRYTKLVGTHS